MLSPFKAILNHVMSTLDNLSTVCNDKDHIEYRPRNVHER